MTEKNLSKLVGQAINDYGMIAAGDRVCVGISGGMDSVALLLLLHGRLGRIPVRYELLPVFVDNFNGANDEHNGRIGRLADFIGKKTGLGMDVLRVNTVESLASPGAGSKKRDTCFLCARKRRAELIRYAFSKGCNRLALGHHKDDIIETSLMNLFYKRDLSSMLPRLPLFGGRLDIIRPLAYIQKLQIESYIYERDGVIPVFGEVCPSKMVRRDLRRDRVRELTALLVRKVPRFKDNLFAAFRNPKYEYLLDHLFKPVTAGLHKRP